MMLHKKNQGPKPFGFRQEDLSCSPPPYKVYICKNVTPGVGQFFGHQQAFRFMVGPGHCHMITKYGPSLFKAVGPVDPSFLVVKKSHINKNIHLTASLQTPQNRKNMYVVNTVKHVISSHSKNKDLDNKW